MSATILTPKRRGRGYKITTDTMPAEAKPLRAAADNVFRSAPQPLSTLLAHNRRQRRANPGAINQAGLYAHLAVSCAVTVACYLLLYLVQDHRRCGRLALALLVAAAALVPMLAVYLIWS